MKSIKFSENELEFLKNHYELELADAENYVSEIKNILTKLNKLEKPGIVEKTGKKTGKKRGRPRKESKTEEISAPVKEAAIKTVKEKPVKEKAVKSKVKEAPKKVVSKKKTAKKRKPVPKKVVKKQIPVITPAETPVS